MYIILVVLLYIHIPAGVYIYLCIVCPRAIQRNKIYIYVLIKYNLKYYC